METITVLPLDLMAAWTKEHGETTIQIPKKGKNTVTLTMQS